MVTFEGIEGSGKSTQVKLLADWLRKMRLPPIVVREPGGTKLGEALRNLLLRHSKESVDSRAELFLYLAARAQLVAQEIEPALEAGRIVIADRFGDASVAYQGGGRKLGTSRVRSMVRFASHGLKPDRTYLLDVPVERSLARVRARGRLDRLEGESITFHRAVRTTYREIASAEPKRVRMLQGSRQPERIAESIMRDMVSLLRNWRGMK